MRAHEFVREKAVGHILTPQFEIVVDDHALDRARERGVDPRAVDYIIKTQLPKVLRKLEDIEVNQKFWVYDWSRELALGMRRLSSTEPRFLLKTVWPGQPSRTPEAERIVRIRESVDADKVLQYVKRVHAPDEFNIEYSITDHPKWELKSIPLSKLKLDPEGEQRDPYRRVNWVDYDKVQDLIPKITSVLKSSPIVVDSQGWIIDGNHRATAAAEAGLKSVPAYVPAEVDENFADGKKPGRKGLSRRVGIPKKATLGQLEKIAKSSSGERRRMAQWQLNMRRGKQKKNK